METLFYRSVPSGDVDIPGFGKILKHDAISFGVEGPPGNGGALTDPYMSGKIVQSEGESSLFGEEVSLPPDLLSYEASNRINKITSGKVWPFYRIREVREFLAAYIGCPTTHLMFASDEGIFPRDDIIPLDSILPASVLPNVIYILILGDWIGTGKERLWREIRITSDMMSWINPEVQSRRVEILNKYMIRTNVLSPMHMREGEMIGQVTRSILHVRPDTPKIISLSRLFYMLHLDESVTPSGQITAMAYDGKIKILKNASIIPASIKEPSESFKLIILSQLPKSKEIHAYLININPDFSISISSAWSGEGAIEKKAIKSRMHVALDNFLFRLYALENDVMTPGYTLPDRKKMYTAISIANYQEEYGDGDFSKLSEGISLLARAELVRITYITASSVYVQIPLGASRERMIDIYRYLHSLIDNPLEFATIWSSDTADAFKGYLLRGPDITIKADGSDLYVLISGCTGDDEIEYAGELSGMLVESAGYKPRGTNVKESRDYANLHLLEQIDPVLFGSRILPGGERSNYSRECQMASRHPVPVKIDEPGAIVLNNFSYGGPQAYKCGHPDYPNLSMRPAPFASFCIPCCSQTYIESSWCSSRMLFSPEEPKVVSKAVSGKPVMFTGQYISEGRLARIPPPINSNFSVDTYLYHPPSVDDTSLHSMIEWVLDMPGIPDYTNEDKVESIGEYLAHGFPVTLIKMSPSSSKDWKAQLLQMLTLQDIPPYLIAMIMADDSVMAYYPIVSMHGEVPAPITVDDLGLRDLSRSSGIDQVIFSYTTLSQLSFPIVSGLFNMGRCVGLNLLINKKILFFPIRSAKVKNIQPVEVSSLAFPSSSDVNMMVRSALEKFPNLSTSVSLVVNIGKDRHTLRLRPDAVMLYLSDKGYPKAFEIEEAPEIAITEEEERLLWNKDIVCELPKPLLSKTIITNATSYFAAKLLESRELMKRISESVHAGEDYSSMMLDLAKKSFSIGVENHIPSEGKHIVLYGRKATITPPLRDLLIEKFSYGIPENPLLMEGYLRHFLDVPLSEYGTLKIWEKILQ